MGPVGSVDGPPMGSKGGSKAHPISGLGWASMHPGIRYIYGLYGLEV